MLNLLVSLSTCYLFVIKSKETLMVTGNEHGRVQIPSKFHFSVNFEIAFH